MNKQLYARKRRQFKSLCKQLNQLLKNESTPTSKRKIEVIALKVRHLLRELSGIIARWEVKKMLGAAAVIFGLSTASIQAQSFAEPQVNPFGISSSTVINIPVLADMDNDGDIDLLLGEYSDTGIANIVYHENVGTASEPSFGPGQIGAFGLDMQSEYTIFPAVADLDADGDLDVLATAYKYDPNATTGLIITYYENIGTASSPQFMAQGGNLPLGTASLSDKYYVAPVFADLDDDGDMDLIVSTSSYDYTDNFSYLENIGTASEPEFGAPQINSLGLTFASGSSIYLALPAVADLDLDGDTDLMSGVNGYGPSGANGMYYFENTGNNTSAQFAVSERNPLGITISPLANYELLIPALADLDNDGDVDMLCTSLYGNFFYYENTLNPVSTTAPQADFSADIFPNPANNYLNINTDEPLTQIEIYDLFGRQLVTYDGLQTEISIQNLSSGTYMIRLINQKGQYLSKRIEKL